MQINIEGHLGSLDIPGIGLEYRGKVDSGAAVARVPGLPKVASAIWSRHVRETPVSSSSPTTRVAASFCCPWHSVSHCDSQGRCFFSLMCQVAFKRGIVSESQRRRQGTARRAETVK